VTALKDFLGEGSRPFSGRSAGKSPELSQSEVARVDGNDIEKTGLRFGVAEFLDPLLFDPNVGNRNFSSNDLKTMPFGNEMFILGRSSARTTLREITVEALHLIVENDAEISASLPLDLLCGLLMEPVEIGVGASRGLVNPW
jgi:hypothetical protein